MGLPRKLKIAIWAALGLMALGIIAGLAVFALTLIRDVTEDTPAAIVGETAGAVVDPVQTMGAVAPSPLDPVGAAADSGQSPQDTPTPMPDPTATPEPDPTETPTPEPTATPEPPSSPESVSASFTGCVSGPSCGVTVSWSAPSSGGPAEYYEALLKLVGEDNPLESGTLGANARSHGFKVSVYGEYKADVRAVNQQGSSSWAGAEVLVANPPTAIASISISRSDDTLSLSWTVPADGGSPIKSYEAQCSTDNGTSWASCASNIAASGYEGSAFSATIKDVDNGSAYVVRARAVNAAGKSGWTKSAQVLALGPPGEATNISVVRDGFTITASWTAAPKATSYDLSLWKWVTAGVPPTVQTLTGVTGTSAEFKLAAAQFNDSHSVAIVAKNQYGMGALRESAEINPPAAPTAPASSTGARSRDGATIEASWSAVTGATGYNLNYTADSGTTWQRSASNVAGASASITGLDKKTSYIISVQAVRKYEGDDDATVILESGWKESGTIHAPPGAPTGVSGTTISNTTTIVWTIPSYRGTGPDGAANKIKYNIYCRGNAYASWTKVASDLMSGAGSTQLSYNLNNAHCRSANPNTKAVTAVNAVEGALGTN